MNTIRVSNRWNPAQDRHSVSPDLDPNYLQRLSADNKSYKWFFEVLRGQVGGLNILTLTVDKDP